MIIIKTTIVTKKLLHFVCAVYFFVFSKHNRRSWIEFDILQGSSEEMLYRLRWDRIRPRILPEFFQIPERVVLIKKFSYKKDFKFLFFLPLKMSVHRYKIIPEDNIIEVLVVGSGHDLFYYIEVLMKRLFVRSVWDHLHSIRGKTNKQFKKHLDNQHPKIQNHRENPKKLVQNIIWF